MLNDKYKAELDNIKASDEFKKRTIALLNEKQAEMASNEISDNIPNYETPLITKPNEKSIKQKTLNFPLILRTAACLAIMLLGVYAYNNFGNPFLEKSAPDEAMPFAVKSSAPSVYTKADAQPIIATQGPPSTNKIMATFDLGGGMGFEGFLAYDITDLENDNPYNINLAFDTLPIYYFTPANADALTLQCKEAAKSIGKKITDISYSWVKIEYKNGQVSTHNFIDTASPLPQNETDILYSVTGKFSGGYIEAHPFGHTLTVFFDPALDIKNIESQNTDSHSTLVGNGEILKDKFNSFINMDQPVCGAFGDFSYRGQRHWNNFVYDLSDDNVTSIFNFSIKPVEFLMTDDNKLSALRKTVGNYEKTDDLPAINAFQALGKLYVGEYLSSVPYDITDDSVVNKIELVYKHSAADEKLMKSEGYVLPMYKFYVELPEMAQENGLKNYGIYYVNAIDENYAQCTMKTIQFN